MKGAFWIPLSSFLFAVSWPCTEQCGFGYELIDFKIEKMTEMFVELVKNNERKIDELAKSISNLIENNQQITEKRINNLNSDMSAAEKMTEMFAELVKNNERKIDELAKSISNSIENNQQVIEKRINNLISDMSAVEKKFTQKFEVLLPSVATLESQSKQILKNHYDLVIPSCSTPNVSGIYKLQFPRINVFCETNSYGGGWLVIQLRSRGDVNFKRDWYEYRSGFGTVGPYTDFWLGLEAIYLITSGGEYELRVDIANEALEFEYAQYSQFKVFSEDYRYKLSIGGYSGTAGNEMSAHNKMKFSTYDLDNDESSRNCAKDYESGWWFNDCRRSNLNGPYKKGTKGFGIEWGNFANAGIYSRMMIRRK